MSAGRRGFSKKNAILLSIATINPSEDARTTLTHTITASASTLNTAYDGQRVETHSSSWMAGSVLKTERPIGDLTERWPRILSASTTVTHVRKSRKVVLLAASFF